MNNPTRGDLRRLRRFGRYLVRATPEGFVVSSSKAHGELSSQGTPIPIGVVAGRESQEWDFKGMMHFSDMVHHPEKRDIEFKEKETESKFCRFAWSVGICGEKRKR